jgi:hypothetical protein
MSREDAEGDHMTDDPYRNPLARRKPLGGKVGVVIVSVTPFVALALFLLFGALGGGWGWAWIFFLLIPVAGVIVYGLGNNNRE